MLICKQSSETEFEYVLKNTLSETKQGKGYIFDRDEKLHWEGIAHTYRESKIEASIGGGQGMVKYWRGLMSWTE
jgi:hypothetical protein